MYWPLGNLYWNIASATGSIWPGVIGVQPVRNNEIGVGDLCQSGRRAVAIGEAKRNGQPRNADFTVAVVKVLIAPHSRKACL